MAWTRGFVGACMTAAAATVLAAVVPANQPATMHAIRVHDFGGPEVLKHEQTSRPRPGPGELLVRVHAAAVNPVDWKIRSGAIAAWAPPRPYTPGFDLSGVVESIGPDVANFKPGDEVYGKLDLRRGGAYAEYAIAKESELALKPRTIDHAHAAAVPLAALTAWQALFDHAGLQPGQTVLIHAAAGGVGHFAVQFAKIKGAKVIATASARNHDFLRDLGADEVIDYRTQRFEDLAKDVDVVLAAVGGDTLERSYGVLKEGGILVSIVGTPSPAKLKEHGVHGASFLVEPSPEQLDRIAALIDEGKVKIEVAEVLPLAEAARAHELSETGHTRGKIVLKVAD